MGKRQDFWDVFSKRKIFEEVSSFFGMNNVMGTQFGFAITFWKIITRLQGIEMKTDYIVAQD